MFVFRVNRLFFGMVGRCYMLAVMLTCSAPLFAVSGCVQYWGDAVALHNLAVFMQDVFNTTALILNAIAAIVAFYSATTIYIKIQTGEEGFAKHVGLLVGAFVYYLVMMAVLPALFAGATDDGGALGWLLDLIW